MNTSSQARGFRWESSALARRTTSFVLATAMTSMAMAAAAPAESQDLVDVIVRATRGSVEDARQAVASLGGEIELELGIIDGFSADVPAAALASLEQNSAVTSVTPDVQVRLQQLATEAVVTDTLTASLTTLDEALTPGNLGLVTAAIKADKLHQAGFRGQGIDVALIDSGVVPVAGLNGPKVAYGPDLSFEADFKAVTNLDTFGHGTHMAGIIAANGGETTGIAPDARIVSVKVADATGATDVSQVIAGIDWVVKNRKTAGRNIRVLNLSFGTDGAQSYAIDPLAYATEVAWKNGIVVVASAGNHGSSLGRLANPAIDPFIIAVGASNTMGTANTSDDTVPTWSAKGNGTRNPDIVAPGRSIESLRSPGSWIDVNNPTARLGETLFRGSGTSQAAAVTSGAVALLLSSRPGLTPDEVKYAITSTATPTSNTDPRAVGNGELDVSAADSARINSRKATQDYATSNGSGTLEGARGTNHVTVNGVTLEGEMTVNGSTWAGSTWAGSNWAGSNWAGSTWAGSTWASSTWAGSTWAGSTWAGSTWAGSTWAGSTWAGSTWAGSTWASTFFWSGLRWE